MHQSHYRATSRECTSDSRDLLSPIGDTVELPTKFGVSGEDLLLTLKALDASITLPTTSRECTSERRDLSSPIGDTVELPTKFGISGEDLLMTPKALDASITLPSNIERMYIGEKGLIEPHRRYCGTTDQVRHIR
jgi:hypothetical protein